MKIGIEYEAEDVVNALGALPVGLQHACYGAGFRRAGSKVKRLARAKAPVGKGIPLKRSGAIRKRLRDSIAVKLVSWRWDGRRVPKSAVIVLAEQPHAHLVEKGSWVYGKYWVEAKPFLWPSLQNADVSREFARGAARDFGKVVKQIRTKKLTKATARALKLADTADL